MMVEAHFATIYVSFIRYIRSSLFIVCTKRKKKTDMVFRAQMDIKSNVQTSPMKMSRPKFSIEAVLKQRRVGKYW